MNTTGLATGGIFGAGLVGASLADQLPQNGPVRVAGEVMLATTGGAFLILVLVALALLVVGFGMRMAGRADA